jgi:hypothetical protein
MKNKQKQNSKSLLAVTVLVFSILGLMSMSDSKPDAIALDGTTTTVSDAPNQLISDQLVSSQPQSSEEPKTSSGSGSEILMQQIAQRQAEVFPSIKPIFVKEKVIGDTIITDSNEQFPLRSYEAQLTPNDPSGNQWWTTSARLPELWDSNTGSSATTLAIIDTGFALDHEEFQGRWKINAGESGATISQSASKLNCSDQSIALNQNCNLIDEDFDGIVDNESGATTEENPSRLNCSDQAVTLDKSCNMIDDDGNGLVDDWRGWDFMNFDNSVQAGDIDPNGYGTKHGSYVTGVAAANANNSVGIAGVNWQTKILPIQALGDGGSGTSISVARGIRYAVDQGADVISLSLGSNLPDGFTRQAVQDAIAAGVIVVAASGNDGCNCIIYPANYPEVVAVGALDINNQPASFSSYGDNLDILAPGTNLYTASWSPTNGTNAYAAGIAGTSLATPIVSAAILSIVGANPSLSPREVIAVLTENTNRLYLPTTAAWSNTLGYGTLDSFAANSRLSTVFAPAQLTAFMPISYGSRLFAGTTYEPNSLTKLYQCAPDDYGTTQIYRLTKGSDIFYSASHVEVYFAKANGYSSQLFTTACASLPIDTPLFVRNINVLREFSNLSTKY